MTQKSFPVAANSESLIQGPAESATQRVLLMQMPWATTTRPSIALGILSRICREENIPVKTIYANMDMNAIIGFKAAARLANERSLYGISEHLFAVKLFGPEKLYSDQFFDVLSKLGLPGEFSDPKFLLHLRDEVIDGFLDNQLKKVLDENPAIVGFTATFNQVMSSLALAAKIKKVRPGIKVIAGGACFDDEMGKEYHRVFPDVIDHIFLGEADKSFREFLRRIKEGKETERIPGTTWYSGAELQVLPATPVDDFNDIPAPDYDDFFFYKDQVEKETGKIFNIEFLPFESSRGCWWGEKVQCIFCGMNHNYSAFREKNVDLVIEDLIRMSSRYRVMKFSATDWIISRKQRARFFQKLKELDLDLQIFFEVRADLAKWEIGLMKDAGITMVQAGIESMSSPILKLMKKGMSNIWNIQFLRWCREKGINVSYNLLSGFPGERENWYADMAKLIPELVHLQPPLHNLHPIEMHRFSYLFNHKEEYGVDECALRLDYLFNFPENMLDPLRIGYFFQFKSNKLAENTDYLIPVKEAIRKWIEAHKEKNVPLYSYSIGPDFIRLTDTRSGAGRYLFLSGLHQDVTLLCDSIQNRLSLSRDLESIYPSQVKDGTLEKVIDELIEKNVLVTEGNQILTLPIGERFRTTEELRRYVLGESGIDSVNDTITGLVKSV